MRTLARTRLLPVYADSYLELAPRQPRPMATMERNLAAAAVADETELARVPRKEENSGCASRCGHGPIRIERRPMQHSKTTTA